MFTEKYRPRRMSEIIGHPEAKQKVKDWFNNWRPGKGALLIHGPVGVGKTSMINAIAEESKMDFIEMNASDYRTAKAIREHIGKSIQQQSLFNRGKVFMIDDIDALSGRSDRGGVQEVIRLIDQTKFPIIITANDPSSKKLKKLRDHCHYVELKKLSTFTIKTLLAEIAKEEGIDIDSAALEELASLSDGDLRGALNDLESISYMKKIGLEDLVVIGDRERESTIQEALNHLFASATVIEARKSMDMIGLNPDEFLQWIESNITRQYTDPEELVAAFDALSMADMFNARIRASRHWRLMVYAIDLMTGGVAVAKRRPTTPDFKRANYPMLIAMMGQTRISRAQTESVLERWSAVLHCSKKKIRTEYLPYLRMFDR